MVESKQRGLELLVGAAVLVMAAVFFAFVYSSTGQDRSGDQTYKAAFDRIDGLFVGSDVRMSGVKIGTITGLDIDPETYMAMVTFAVTQEVKLPKDSSAEVVSDGLLGGKYLALVPGGDETYLSEGDVLTYTQSSVNLESLIGQLIFSNKGKGESDQK